MNDHGVVTASDTIRFERLLPGPIERVWAYLTESDKRGKWLASGPMELKAGGKAEFRFDHSSLSPIKEPVPERYKSKTGGVTLQIRVIECDPPRRLVMSWLGGTKEGTPKQDSEVTFELEPQGEKVRLRVIHRRLADRAMLLGVAGGWHTHLAILADNLEGRTPRPFWSTHEKHHRDYEERLKDL
jgi:uncharacterized protein YndB with AHSA1/START domain